MLVLVGGLDIVAAQCRLGWLPQAALQVLEVLETPGICASRREAGSYIFEIHFATDANLTSAASPALQWEPLSHQSLVTLFARIESIFGRPRGQAALSFPAPARMRTYAVIV